jgi:hypothetical protein
MSNSAGNTNRDVRKFLRDNGIPATLRNVELIGREVRRSEAENERVEREAKERGDPTCDEHGPIGERVKRAVRSELRSRAQRRR